MTDTGLLASAGSLENIKKLVREYFYDSDNHMTFEKRENEIVMFNNKGELKNFRIIKKKNRYRFEYRK